MGSHAHGRPAAPCRALPRPATPCRALPLPAAPCRALPLQAIDYTLVEPGAEACVLRVSACSPHVCVRGVRVCVFAPMCLCVPLRVWLSTPTSVRACVAVCALRPYEEGAAQLFILHYTITIYCIIQLHGIPPIACSSVSRPDVSPDFA
jgi:hypothetical protein